MEEIDNKYKYSEKIIQVNLSLKKVYKINIRIYLIKIMDFVALVFISTLTMFKVDLEFKFSHFTKDVYYVKLDICGIKLFSNSSKEL